MNIKKLLIFSIILSVSAFLFIKIIPLDYVSDKFIYSWIKVARAASPGDLIKVSSVPSVYYLGDDNKRYVFPSDKIYFSWYKNFDDVVTVSLEELQSHPLGANITMRAGTKLVKITTDPSVYAVEPNGVLVKIKNESQAQQLFGDNWAQRVIDIPDAFFMDYSLSSELAEGEFPKGSLIKDFGIEKYYYYDEQGFHQISNSQAFNDNRFYSEYFLQARQAVSSSSTPINSANQTILGLIQKRSGNTFDNIATNQGAIIPVISGGGGGGGSSGGGGGGNSGGGGGGGGGGDIIATCSGSDIQSCAITNGQGTQSRTCSSGVWSNWSSCTVTACSNGFQISGNSCIATTCSGNSSQTCSIANGSGTQSRTCDNGVWSNWASCLVSSCNAGYQSSGNSCVDLTAPVVTNFTIPASASALTVPVTTFMASDVVGVTAYILTETSLTPSLAASSWAANAQTVYTFLSAGAKTLYAWARDAAGNISASVNDSVTITLPSANTVYIDPAYNGTNGTENGTIDRPYNAWSDVVFQNNMTYLQKRGTTATTPAKILLYQRSNVRIADYGSGEKPIINYTGSGNFYAVQFNQCTDCTIENMRVTAPTAGGLIAIIGMGSDTGGFLGGTRISVIGCELWKAGSDSSQAMGIRAGGNNVKILNTIIHDISVDGIYAADAPGIEIGYSHIYDINRGYFSNPNQSFSSGDGIQLDGNYNGFHIHHTTVDRLDETGNKYGVIVSNGSVNTYTGTIEYSTFRSSSRLESAVIIERGTGIIVRYNTFDGVSAGLKIGNFSYDTLIHNNLFYGCSRGVSFGWNASKPNPDKIYNNVFYNFTGYNTVNGVPYPPFHVFVQQGSNVEMKNNIHLRGSDAAIALQKWGGLGTVTMANNCYGTAATVGTSGTGTSAVIGDPLFVNASNYNFHLQPGSPCINAGTIVNLPYAYDRDGVSIPQGSAPDIGAYEY